MIWETARGALDLTRRGVIMAILNVTPDSFSDGGRYATTEDAIEQGVRMHAEGAEIVDVGGESTRPGATPVTAGEERRRVLPVIAGLAARIPDCYLSVDTSKAEVARAALEAGAAIINDVTALRGEAAMSRVVAETGAGLVLMHMQGSPRDMQADPRYDDVVKEVHDELAASVEMAVLAGIPMERIALDPGIGFGKTVAHNLALLRRVAALGIARRPLLLGVSRKSFLGHIAGAKALGERLWPTVALTAYLRAEGARVFRVHDVAENVMALRTVEAVLGSA